MKNELKIFENEAFGKVRIIEKNNEPWFVGKDVADILGYKNGSRDINVHVDEEDRLKYQIRTAGQAREQTLINESGLYSLILYSKLPAAKKFKRLDGLDCLCNNAAVSELANAIRLYSKKQGQVELKLERLGIQEDSILNILFQMDEKNKKFPTKRL